MAFVLNVNVGQYYWVYMMAPPKYKRISSYIVGWLTSLAWIATVATETLFAGTMIQGALTLDYPGYEGKLWHGTLITWAVMLVCIFINVVIPNWLPRFEIFILVFHLAGFVAILTTLWVMTPSYASSHTVWATSLNEGGWPTQGLSYCVGFLGNVATFVGADASVHLAEEVSNAALNIPRAIIGAMCINGVVGFIMIVTTLYCIGDLDTVLNTATGFPFIQIFYDSVRNVAGATVMLAVVIALTWGCATGIMTTASRMTWSFARDRGLPFSKYLGKVNPRTKIPVIAVLACTGIAALLTLIYVGSATAFNDVVSLTITGFYGSYLFPAALLLYHRIKGNVLPYGTEINTVPAERLASGDKKLVNTEQRSGDSDTEEVVNARLVWGPWRVPGILGILNNLYACAYMIFVIFWSVWPPEYHVTPSTMNYSIVVTGGVMILSGIWYFIGGKKQYKGPLIDDEVAAVMRVGSVVAVH